MSVVYFVCETPIYILPLIFHFIGTSRKTRLSTLTADYTKPVILSIINNIWNNRTINLFTRTYRVSNSVGKRYPGEKSLSSGYRYLLDSYLIDLRDSTGFPSFEQLGLDMVCDILGTEITYLIRCFGVISITVYFY